MFRREVRPAATMGLLVVSRCRGPACGAVDLGWLCSLWELWPAFGFTADVDRQGDVYCSLSGPGRFGRALVARMAHGCW